MSIMKKEESFSFVATSITFSEDQFSLFLVDGRTLSIPYELVPSLSRASKAARENCELLGMGTSLHWPELDEDISVEGLVLGRKIIDWEKSA